MKVEAGDVFCAESTFFEAEVIEVTGNQVTYRPLYALPKFLMCSDNIISFLDSFPIKDMKRSSPLWKVLNNK